MIDDDADRGHPGRDAADPRDAADRLVAAALARRWSTTTRPPSWSMWWDWCRRPAYDSERQRVSLEQKLGALP